MNFVRIEFEIFNEMVIIIFLGCVDEKEYEKTQGSHVEEKEKARNQE